MAKYIVLLAIFLPLILGECNVKRAKDPFSKSIFDFSIELSSRIAVENDYHFVTSPLSVWSVISAASKGAAGTTLEEIQTVLKHHRNECLNNKYYVIANNVVTQQSPNVTVERSAAVVIDETLKVKRYFIKKIERSGTSKVFSHQSSNLEQVADDINSYISNATHGLVDELLSGEELANKPLLLLDTIYFKGSWQTPFLASETRPAPFYNENQEPIGNVNLMFVNDKFSYTYMDLLGAQVLELPYVDEKFSMLIFLPYEGITLKNVLEELIKISLRSIYALFEETPARTVMVQLPRFKIKTDLDGLEQLLKDMGLEAMFDPAAADFSGISDFPVHVDGLKQKACIEVDENGAAAAATTDLEFEDRSLPPQIVIQKPFLFMIVHKPSEVVLFTGAYSEPSVI